MLPFLEYVSFPCFNHNKIDVPPFCRGMDIKEPVKNKIPWDGTLSLNDFTLSAFTFSDKWKLFNPFFPPWLWTTCPKHHLGSSHKVTPLT